MDCSRPTTLVVHRLDAEPGFRSPSGTSRTRTTTTGTPARSTFRTARASAGYVAQLKAYDQAFAKFFDRLAAAGITKDNTLFVVTNEEGDHFVGSQPTPTGCDGVNTPCSYSTVSEINGNLAGLLATQKGITTPFTVHSDMAPTVYITGKPARTDRVTRNFERAVGTLTAVSPYTGRDGQPDRRPR